MLSLLNITTVKTRIAGGRRVALLVKWRDSAAGPIMVGVRPRFDFDWEFGVGCALVSALLEHGMTPAGIARRLRGEERSPLKSIVWALVRAQRIASEDFHGRTLAAPAFAGGQTGNPNEVAA